MKLLHLIYICSLLLLASCGGGGSNSTGSATPSGGGSGTNSQTGLPKNLNGLLVFQLYETGWGGRGVFMIELNKGGITKSKLLSRVGQSPYAYDRNTIAYATSCGSSSSTQFVRTTSSKRNLPSSPITPCTNKVQQYYAPIAMTKISPDKSKVLINIITSSGLDNRNVIIIYDIETKKELRRFPQYSNADWHPDGRILLTNNDSENTGIFITDKIFSSNLTRIDKEQINQPIYQIDVSPSGKKLVFNMASDIWIMDINGGNLDKLVTAKTGADELTFPTWSPDEKYIAYLTYIGLPYDQRSANQKISFYSLESKTDVALSTVDILTPAESFYDYTPMGSLSWVE